MYALPDILGFVPICYLLFSFFSFPPVLCLSPSQPSYDLYCLSPIDLVGFRLCAHLLRFTCYHPRSPHQPLFRVRTYLAPFFLPCDFSFFLSLSLLAARSLVLYVYLLFRFLSIPRIHCRCCDGIYLNTDKIPSTSPKG